MMFEHGVARAGYVEVPRDPDLGFEFLNVAYVPVQHYGVELNRCRYNGPALDGYRGKASPYLGEARGRWPIHFDSDDVSHVFFRDPQTRKWHALAWEHAPMLDAPFSLEALQLARRAAAAKYAYPDDRLAVSDLLRRWNVGLSMSRAERRMALRIAREQAAIELPGPGSGHPAEQLASVRKILDAPAASAAAQPPHTQAGDDDDPGELDLMAPSPAGGEDTAADLQSDVDFYATALKDADD